MVKCSECKYWSKNLGFLPGAVQVNPDISPPDPAILAMAYQDHNCSEFESARVPSKPPTTTIGHLKRLLADTVITPRQYYEAVANLDDGMPPYYTKEVAKENNHEILHL